MEGNTEKLKMMRSTKGQRQRQGAPFHSNAELRKGLWSPDEDKKLFNYIIRNGLQGCTWTYVAKQAGN